MKRIVGILVLIFSCASLCMACADKDESNPSSKKESDISEKTQDKSEKENIAASEAYVLPQKLDNADLVIVWETSEEYWKEMQEKDPNAFNMVWSTKEAFEKKYGGHVEVIAVEWEKMIDQTISMVSKGETCDIVTANDQNFPTYVQKGIVQDISKYIDTEDDFWFDNVTQAFTFSGKPYAVGTDATPVVIYYNKTLFEKNNVKTPREYLKEGKWNWDAFEECGEQMTKDVDGDSKLDIYGFGWWDSFWVQMLNANGGTSMIYGDDGSVKSNFKSQEASETIQFLQNAYSEKGFIKAPDGDSFINDF